MKKQTVDPQYATGAIKKQMAGVIDHLSGKKGDLSAQSAKYDELARQVGGKASGDKVMVLLGDGYFVEHTVAGARLFLERRISHIGQAVAEVEARIKEARETVTRFEAYARHEEFSMEDGIVNVASEQKKSLNEEGLPFIEIREELDEEGNVVAAKVDGVAQLLPEALPSSHVERVAEGEAPETPTGIMNIVETLDDDGNVVGAVVEPEEARSSANTKVEKVGSTSPTHDHVRDLLEEMEVTASRTVNENELLERIDRLEVSADDKFRLKAIALEEYRKAPGSQDQALDAAVKPPAAAIDPSDLIELEILANDFDDDDGGDEFADDEEWDFEFSDDADDDDSDDDMADELLYGAKRPDFIANNGLNNRLWQEVMALRGDGPPAPKGRTKSVRFAAQLDIKEVENVGEELKNIQHVNQNVSRFMQSRAGRPKIEAIEEEVDTQPVEVITDNAVVEDPPVADASRAKRKSRFKSMREENGNTAAESVPSPLAVAPRETEEAPLSDVVERQVVDQPQMQSPRIDEETQTEGAQNPTAVLSDVVESATAPLVPPQAPTGRNQSKFRMQRDKSQTAFRSITPKPVPIDPGKPLDRRAEIVQSITEIEDEVVPTEEHSLPTEGEITAVEATMDYQSMQNDMDTMARAYVLGMYDDDIVTEGPVVDKLEDFEIINKIVEDRAAKGDVSTTATADNEREDEEDEEDDDDILRDVIERDTSLDPAEDAEDTILAHEVQTNYHRLRRQLMQAREAGYRKTDAEMEFEPIDEFGNPVKISRFRSARLN